LIVFHKSSLFQIKVLSTTILLVSLFHQETLSLFQISDQLFGQLSGFVLFQILDHELDLFVLSKILQLLVLFTIQELETTSFEITLLLIQETSCFQSA
jgi:hypothetical protein